MARNFTFTKEDVLGIMMLDAYEAWKCARGESIEEEKRSILKKINQDTFQIHEVDAIRNGIHGLDFLKLKLANRGEIK